MVLDRAVVFLNTLVHHPHHHDDIITYVNDTITIEMSITRPESTIVP